MGKQRVTIKEIAELAFVSRSVVSRVLNNHPDVNAETRERVLAVIKEYNYRPKSIARSLVTDRTQEVCILIPRWEINVLSSSFWSVIFMGLTEQCQNRGYYVSVSIVPADIENVQRDPFFLTHDFDGYILMHREVTESAIPALKEWAVPFVVIGYDSTHKDINSIDVDNYKGGYLAGNHLVKMGHQKIGFVSGDLKRQEAKDRYAGFVKALGEGGVAFDDTFMTAGAYSYQFGADAFSFFSSLSEFPTAVFCASDIMARGLMFAAYENGMRVPEDLAIVGFDDLPGASYSVPPLTTVRQPIYEKGVWAIDMLIDKIENKETEPKHVKLKPTLVIRKSCGSTDVGTSHS